MADSRQDAEVRRTVRRVSNYWYRAGVPRGVRREKSEELRVHLIEAVGDGRLVEDVAGRDLAAFAAEWAEAERSRPLLDLTLQSVAAITLLPGALALLNPALSSILGQDDGRTGVAAGFIAFLVAFLPFIVAWQLIRVRRHRFTTQQTAILGVALVVTYAVVLGAAQAWGRDSEVLLVMSPVTAWTLVAVGAGVQLVASWLKRSRWR